MYDIILFDLDGTLTDSGLGITNSVKYALEKEGITVNDRSELFRFIGPPLVESFQKFYGFSPEKALEITHVYREYYSEKGIFENEVYDGIEELLRKLKENGKRIIVATSKPELFARKIFDHFSLSQYFEYIAGSNMNETRTGKSEVIEYALESCGVTNLEKVIMVGDREHDIWGAKKTGTASIGVIWGYGSREELQKAGADYIAQTPDEVFNIVMK
ncbi:MAG: HAD family hydrolase [Acutalibacteraceae bacterium]